LEPKSVVLLDELTAHTHKGQGGTARLKVGLGRAGTLDAELFLEQGRFWARVTGVTLGQTPLMPRQPTAVEERAAEILAGESDRAKLVPAGAESEQETTSPQGLQAEASGKGRRVEETNEGVELLSDIPLQIVVELARVPVTAEEVVS